MAVQAVPIDDVQTVINYTELTKPMNINPDALVDYPKQIKELGPMPKIPKNGYEGYFYRFTNLDKLKYYIGSRKGLIKDHYWHSSTCDEFNRDLANPNANFKFEILKVGKHNIMEVIEDEMLRDVKAGQNPSYYNKQSAGSPKYKRTNQKACKQLRDDILSGKYKSKTEEKVTDLIKFIEEDRFFQVRVKLNEEKIIFVANAVDDDIGNTELCQIVILENRSNGEDVLIDGNHTVRGLARSKHGKYTFTHRIPEEIHKSFRDQEIIVLCSWLNPVPKFQKDPLSPIDTVEKVLMGEIENGVDVKDESLYEITREGGYGKAKTTTILKKLDIEVATKRWRRLTGRTVIDYTVGTAKKDLEALIASTKNSTTMCIHKTSGMWKADDWMNEIYINHLDFEKLNLVIYVTHPAPTMSKNWYEDWTNGESAIERQKILFWLDSQKKGKKGEEKPYTLRMTDMPYDVPNEL